MAERKYKVDKVAIRTEDGTKVELWTAPDGDQQLVMVLGKKALEFAEFHRNGIPEPEGLQLPHVLAKYYANERKLVTFPCSTKPNKYVYDPKYDFRSITFENQQPLQLNADTTIVHGLPSGFEPNPMDGFGLYYPLRFIFKVFEQTLGVEDITMCDDEHMSFKDGVVRFPIFKYHFVRTAINRAHRAALDFANDEKKSYLRSEILSELMPGYQIQGSFQRSAYDLDRSLKAALSGTTRLRRSNENAIAAVRTIRSAARSVVKESPAEILELNREIELVTLESLIQLLAEKLDRSLAESYWQKLLMRNPFILKLAFGLPVAIFGEQVSVGGADFKGKGGKIADFWWTPDYSEILLLSKLNVHRRTCSKPIPIVREFSPQAGKLWGASIRCWISGFSCNSQSMTRKSTQKHMTFLLLPCSASLLPGGCQTTKIDGSRLSYSEATFETC